MGNKYCSRCCLIRSQEDFAKHSGSPDGLQWWCKPCWYGYRRENSAKVAEINNASRRKVRYGVDRADVAEMIESQGGVCDICKNPPPGTGRDGWMVDHDHETGKVRGMLCAMCNKGLGNFKDDSTSLLNAALYLAKHNA